MEIIIITKENTRVPVDRTMFVSKSRFILEALFKDNEAKEIEIKLLPESHLHQIIKYLQHHAKKETPAPIDSVKTTYTLDTMFDDKWDGKFFQAVMEEEKDPNLIEFSTSVDYMQIDTLLRKTIMCIVQKALQKAMGKDKTVNKDKLVEEFSKLSAV